VGIGVFLSYNMVNGFDLAITMSNDIFEQPSNETPKPTEWAPFVRIKKITPYKN